MRVVFGIFVFFIIILFFIPKSPSTTPSTIDKDLAERRLYNKEYNINQDLDRIEKLMVKDCVQFIECLSSKEVAREYGQTEQWVVANYRVNVWEKTTANGKGKKVGEMRSGSRALILRKSFDDYRIQSPLDKSIGWVNQIQVAKTLYQNPRTFKKCR